MYSAKLTASQKEATATFQASKKVTKVRASKAHGLDNRYEFGNKPKSKYSPEY